MALEDGFVSPEGLAAYSSLSTRTLRRLSADPVHPLPVHEVGGRRLYRKAEFDQWLREDEARRRGEDDRVQQIAVAITRGRR